jgi:cell division septum initiation protein DivIVA
MTENEYLQQQIDELKETLEKFTKSSTIPFEVGAAFADRIAGTQSPLLVSTKTASSEFQAVNEAGAAAYSVLKQHDGFLQITIDGTVYYLPYYS